MNIAAPVPSDDAYDPTDTLGPEGVDEYAADAPVEEEIDFDALAKRITAFVDPLKSLFQSLSNGSPTKNSTNGGNGAQPSTGYGGEPEGAAGTDAGGVNAQSIAAVLEWLKSAMAMFGDGGQSAPAARQPPAQVAMDTTTGQVRPAHDEAAEKLRLRSEDVHRITSMLPNLLGAIAAGNRGSRRGLDYVKNWLEDFRDQVEKLPESARKKRLLEDAARLAADTGQQKLQGAQRFNSEFAAAIIALSKEFGNRSSV